MSPQHVSDHGKASETGCEHHRSMQQGSSCWQPAAGSAKGEYTSVVQCQVVFYVLFIMLYLTVVCSPLYIVVHYILKLSIVCCSLALCYFISKLPRYIMGNNEPIITH